MKTGVRHTMKLVNYTSSSTVVQTDNGYKSEQEQAVTFGIYKTSKYTPERCHQNYFLQKHTEQPPSGHPTGHYRLLQDLDCHT